MTEQGYHRVARVEEIPDGEARAFDVAGERIAVCRAGGEIFAVEDTCSHDGAPLGNERLEGHVIECPRHGARFDVRDGRVLRMPAVAPIRTFPVRIESGTIYVRVEEE